MCVGNVMIYSEDIYLEAAIYYGDNRFILLY